jgi:hypothetical protein
MCLNPDIAQPIPAEALILRYRNAIEEKFQKLVGYLNNGVVKAADPYVIAVNGRALPHSIYEPPLPRIVQALFPLGDMFVTFDSHTKRLVDSGHHYRPKIEKKNGQPVSTIVFLDPTYDAISAVLFCPSDVWHFPANEAQMGLDFTLIHNPMAKKNPLPYRWLKCGREFWVEGDQLVINDWYKEHPSYVKETEAVVTLQEHLQKHRAQRRVKDGEIPHESE